MISTSRRMNRILIAVLVVYARFVGGIPHQENKRLLLHINDAFKVGEIDDGDLDEASGLCASRIHPGILYTHNDHGGHNRLYVIDSRNASVIALITVNGAINGDWEDIACGKCYGHLNDSCIYIGDTGDSAHQQTIYRIVEPSVLTEKLTVNLDGTLRFSWSEADTETLMVTPDAELYIISKSRDASSKIGHVPSQGWSQTSRVPITTTANLAGVTTHHKDPRGGDISPDGQEILLKTDTSVLHFSMNGSKDYMSVLQQVPVRVPYTLERQGESVAFSADGRSYFTLGEGRHEPLYRYDASF